MRRTRAFTYSDELYHYGILGMKWGVRRFQNEDGTLTEAGKKRYGKLTSEIEKSYIKGTKHQRKIVANEKGKYSDYKVKKAQLWIDAKKKLKDIQEEEVKNGLDYYENKLSKNQFLGQLVAGIPGQLVAAGLTALKNKEGYEKRMQIDDEYRKEMKSLKNENKLKKEEQKQLKNLGASEGSLLDFYKNRTYGKGIDDLTGKGSSKNGFSKEQKEESMTLAKYEGRYNIDFLEAVQNSEMFYKQDEKRMLKEYGKFLDDPEKYWKEDRKKLKEV